MPCRVAGVANNAVFALLMLMLGACQDATSPDTTVVNVLLTVPQTTMNVGTHMQLTAVALNRTGDSLRRAITFSGDPTSTVTVSPTGLVSAIGPGEATVRANAGGQTASMTISVVAPPCDSTWTTTPITTSHVVGGVLSVSDCQIASTGYADGYTLNISAPMTVAFRMLSSSLRPSLLVAETGKTPLPGQPLGNVTHFIASYYAGDTITLIADLTVGAHTLWVSGSGVEVGAYTVFVRPTTLCSFVDAADAIAVNQTVVNTLDDTDCHLAFGDSGGVSGVEAAGHPFTLDTRSAVRFELKSNEFLPTLLITTREMNSVASGILLSDSVSRFEGFLPAGEYIAWASAVQVGIGSYSLSRAALPVTPCGPATVEVPRDESIFLELSSSDCMVELGYYSDPLRLTLPEAPGYLRIEVMSSAFDAFLYLMDAEGTIFYSDNDGGFENWARFEGTLPAGVYTIFPTSYRPNVTGAYAVYVFVSPP